MVEQYARTDISAGEALVLERFREAFAGRVLEVGCGAGRVTGHMAAIGGEVHAVDISPAMVEYTAARYPGVQAAVGDLRDLSPYRDGAFDVVSMWCNIVDILSHEDRPAALAGARDALTPGGLLVLDTHNLAHGPYRRRPADVSGLPLRQQLKSVLAIPVKLRNHRRLSRQETFGDGWAILNDEAHRFLALHYYVDREEQRRQLEAAGFELLAVVDEDGRVLGPGEQSVRSASLKYVARRA